MKQAKWPKLAGLWLLVATLITPLAGRTDSSRITIDVVSKDEFVIFLLKNYENRDFQCGEIRVQAKVTDKDGRVARRSIIALDVNLPANSLEIRLEAGKEVIGALRSEMNQPRIVDVGIPIHSCKPKPQTESDSITPDKKVFRDRSQYDTQDRTRTESSESEPPSYQSQYTITFTKFFVKRENHVEFGKSEYFFYVYAPNQRAYMCIPSDCRSHKLATQGDTVLLNVEVSEFAASDYVYIMVLEADRYWNVLNQTPDAQKILLSTCPDRIRLPKPFLEYCLQIPVLYLLDTPYSCLMMATKSGSDKICLFYQIEAIEPPQNVPETGTTVEMDTTDESVAELEFPSQIKYNILRGGSSVGNALLEFNKLTIYGKNLFSLHLGNFTGLGIQSNQTLHTYVEQEALSLYAASLCDGKRCTKRNWIYEIRIKDRLALDLSKTKIYAYKERSNDSTIEKVLDSKAKVVDLLSAFLVTTEAVRHAEIGAQKINLFVGNSIKLVDLRISETEERVTLSSGKQVNAKAVSIGRYGEVVFKFYIYKDKRDNVYFPVQVDMNVERGFTLEAVRWSSGM
jgi:hypothetical protein